MARSDPKSLVVPDAAEVSAKVQNLLAPVLDKLFGIQGVAQLMQKACQGEDDEIVPYSSLILLEKLAEEAACFVDGEIRELLTEAGVARKKECA